ncbi:recombinase family protein [Microbacterium sp. LWH13-1.2]|uniref:recombinase family protein n=1 Tax=Microbacterium sp. LWH13-1.2 TaxID=3135260 RepID=UPI003139FCA4
MAIIGYTRVSTKDQDTASQDLAMTKAKVDRVYTDHGVSGALASRPELDKALDRLDRGDTFVVWKLDRLGRNTRNVLEVIETLIDRGVTFKSLTEQIDLSAGPMGKAMLTILAAFAELERATMAERTRAGLEAAKAKGNVGGRPSVVDAKKLATIMALVRSGDHTRADIARMVGISPATLYRVLQSA